MKTAAVLTIVNPNRMSVYGRRRVVAWLRRQARFLSKHSKELGPNFRARYLYR